MAEMAEREGFEPSVPLAEHDDLANRCLRPLGHLSKKDNDANASNRPIHYQTRTPAVKHNLLAIYLCRLFRKDATLAGKMGR